MRLADRLAVFRAGVWRMLAGVLADRGAGGFTCTPLLALRADRGADRRAGGARRASMSAIIASGGMPCHISAIGLAVGPFPIFERLAAALADGLAGP